MTAHRAMPLLIALLTATAPGAVTAAPAAEVAEVRLAPDGDRTEISVLAGEGVEVRDFLLEEPTRLVLDLEGARHALPRQVYEGIGRGGVVALRTSQFRNDVVRLVFELSRVRDYEVRTDGDRIRIRFSNPGGTFEAWSTSTAAPGLSEEVADQLRRAEDGGSRSGRDAASRSPAEPAASQASEQPRISVTYDSASILDVIAGFAEFSGTSIVPGAGVAGKTVRGVDIRNQPWDVALDAILSSQGLGWRRTESGILLVDELSDLRGRDTLRTETRVLRINYAGADTVARALQELASDKGRVVAYQGTNSVIVTDRPSVVGRMDSLVQVLDRRTAQVSIEAKIIFVDRTNVNALGLAYDLKEREGAGTEQSVGGLVPTPDPQEPGQTTDETVVNFGGDAISAVANANSRVASPALSILASTAFGDFSLFAFVDALEEHRLSDVQAAPSIQVVDNHEARIQVGERTPIRVLEPSAQLSQAQVNVQFEDTGIILEVTPHITNNNQILLDLSAERSDVAAGPSDIGFIFEKQIGQTRLLLDDGETAVIGGLTLSEVTRSETGIPGLMNLPLVGGLFRTSNENENKRDLIILVTPHIVNAPRSGPAGAAATGSPAPRGS